MRRSSLQFEEVCARRVQVQSLVSAIKSFVMFFFILYNCGSKRGEMSGLFAHSVLCTLLMLCERGNAHRINPDDLHFHAFVRSNGDRVCECEYEGAGR